MVQVSWHDTQAYIAWLRQVTEDQGWRLPTEAEWEKAAPWDARVQHAQIYPWGDQWDKRRANTNKGGPHLWGIMPIKVSSMGLQSGEYAGMERI